MKITIECREHSVCVTHPNAETMPEVLEMVYYSILACGFQTDTLERYLPLERILEGHRERELAELIAQTVKQRQEKEAQG